jgi:hypothetical protein
MNENPQVKAKERKQRERGPKGVLRHVAGFP